MTRITLILQLIIFSCLCFSCQQEKYNPIGIWEQVDRPENKIIIQAEGTGYASREKGSYYWEIFTNGGANSHKGDKENILEIYSDDSLMIYHRDLKTFNKIYRKTNAKIEGFWLLNQQMPKDNVIGILGEPDSISTATSLEQWFYGDDKVIRFNKHGVISYSDNNKINPEYHKVEKGFHYDEVIRILGDADWEQEGFSQNNQHVFSIFYGDNAKVVFRDSLAYSIVPDLNRNTEEWITLIDCDAMQYDFIEIQKDTFEVAVEERGRNREILKPDFTLDDDRGYLKLKGRSFNLIIKFQSDNTYKAVYSRYKTRRRSKERILEIVKAENLLLKIDPIALGKNLLIGRIDLSIKEKAAKNTVVYGEFQVDLNEHQ